MLPASCLSLALHETRAIRAHLRETNWEISFAKEAAVLYTFFLVRKAG